MTKHHERLEIPIRPKVYVSKDFNEPDGHANLPSLSRRHGQYLCTERIFLPPESAFIVIKEARVILREAEHRVALRAEVPRSQRQDRRRQLPAEELDHQRLGERFEKSCGRSKFQPIRVRRISV